ncbi:BTAD domain-containing putative transcriptional regulator [Nocardiopsis sp. N85]|uniref:AfsR/SARP family transcriptional regulator n=1 Tax=Nocardiopsis sp. N85 TaxID=3029400 RepID=UPI00237FBF42|nr:AfsR/SARP family transcriptional regulator [Nocardiopsis sp. N85]MDE3723090.1 BTAD domain-containing putative transcriptional regulator [Nocardiopsis sp. N85]
MPPGRQQAVLAALLLRVGTVVATDHLVDALWEHDPPETARTQVQICVSRLRRLLRSTGAVIHTRTPGYVLAVPEEAVDLPVYRRLVEQARGLREGGDLPAAVETLRRAETLWRGPALSGVDCGELRERAARLDEEHLDVLEARAEIEIGLGRHGEIAAELGHLVEAYPLHEGLRAGLMLALYRSGRRADALEVYRVGRELLLAERGSGPGERLRVLEEHILVGDHHGVPPRRAIRRPPARRIALARAVPYQLPNPIADFVGREDATAAVRDAVVRGDDGPGTVLLVGRPGVGKSATAVHVAHLLAREHHPEGQLYCDLRGSRDGPVRPVEVLGRFLRALGVPDRDVPPDAEGRGALYRDVLADRRVLVLLDDAASAEQVVPLLPTGRGCGAILTSRSRLAAPPGARVVGLDLPSEAEALDLLAEVIGRERVAGETGAARTLVGMVGRLPLALRVVAARLVARPHWSIAAMVERLADERRRLDELAHRDLTVRPSLPSTHDGLDDRQVRAFTLASVMETPTVPAWAIGAVLDDPRPRPSELSGPLVDAYVLDVVGTDLAGEPIHRFHDLVRVHARERLWRSTVDRDRRACLGRVLGGWLTLLDAAVCEGGGDHRRPPRGDAPRWRPHEDYVRRAVADPEAWFDGERVNLRHAIAQAAAVGAHGQCWELTAGTAAFLVRRGLLDELADVHRIALSAVRAGGDRFGEAVLAVVVAPAVEGIDDAERVRAQEGALEVFTRHGDERGRVLALRGLAHPGPHPLSREAIR